MKTVKTIVAGAVGGALSFGMFFYFSSPKEKVIEIQKEVVTQPSIKPIQVAYNGGLTPVNTKDFTYAAEKTVNSVVHIKSIHNQKYTRDPYLDYFWGAHGSRGVRPMVATGSGVIISADGYIVTNNHVIKGADKVSVSTNDGHVYDATIIGTDPGTDLALIKIDEDDLPYSEFANSDNVKVGEWVLAVGNPFDLTSTVTAGIVSAKARNINLLKRSKDVFPLESFIQTDAAVNPGNSGGALVNTNGELVGINTAIASKTGSYSGYSFAVPSNIARKVTEDLLAYGVVQRAYIGVGIADVNQQIADELGLKDLKGVLVSALADGGAAQEAGIEVEDVILKVGNVEVNDVPQLQEQIGKFRPGDKVNLTIRRDGEEKIITVKLRNREGKTNLVSKEELNKFSILGADFKPLNNQELRALRIKNGVKIDKLQAGKLRSAGITEGFVITHLNKKPVYTPKEVVEFFKNKKGGVLVEGVYPNGMKGYVGFGL